MTASDFLLVIAAALVGYRAARLVTTDSLFEGTRDRLETWGHLTSLVLGTEERSYRWVEIGGRQRPWLTILRGKFVDLVTCPYCIGFWLTLAAWFILTGTSPGEATLVEWGLAVAASGLQSLLWSAVEDVPS